jgi:pyridoxamine 5'-phosphate oxidase
MTDPVEGSLHHMRENYEGDELDIQNVYPSPFTQFSKWFTEAQRPDIPEPNAMVLSTATAEGRPSSRVVLLKEFTEKGFVFFTNYESHKGKELQKNPHACLNFWWPALERQVRINGITGRISASDSDTYFYSRPVGSQAGAIASPQSRVIVSREWLEQRFIEVQLRGNIKRPEHWGGYLLEPYSIEFWQGRSNRLHDRLLYEKKDAIWVISRLAP